MQQGHYSTSILDALHGFWWEWSDADGQDLAAHIGPFRSHVCNISQRDKQKHQHVDAKTHSGDAHAHDHSKKEAKTISTNKEHCWSSEELFNWICSWTLISEPSMAHTESPLVQREIGDVWRNSQVQTCVEPSRPQNEMVEAQWLFVKRFNHSSSTSSQYNK